MRLGLCAFGLSLCAPIAWAQDFAGVTSKIEKQLAFYLDQDIQIANWMRARSSDIVDSDDRRTIERYYAEVRQKYLSSGLNAISDANFSAALDEYSRQLRSLGFALSHEERGLIAWPPNRSDATHEERLAFSSVQQKKEFNECLNSAMQAYRPNERANEFKVAMGELKTLHSNPMVFGRNLDFVNAYSQNLGRVKNSLKGLDVPTSVVNECCQSSNLENELCLKQIERLNKAKSDLVSKLSDSLPAASYIYAPNPLAVEELSGKDLADIIRERRSMLSKLRQGGTDEKYVDEQDVFETMARCRIRAKQFQNNRVPLQNQAINALGKTIKCAVLPAIATQNWKTPYAKMTYALGAAPIEGKNFEFNCDPNEMMAWDQILEQGRDPNAWGIPQMANPPYIASLRSIPPVSTGLPGVGITADDYIRMMPAPGLENINVGANQSRTSVRVANAQSGTRLGGRSSTLSTGVSRSNGAAIERGQGLAQAVRTSSANIRNNKQSDYYSSRMLMGAKNTGSFLSTGVSRSRVISTADAQNARKQEASVARDRFLRSVGTRASRTTSEGILNDLDRSNSKIRSVDTVGQRNRQIRDEVKVMVQKYLDNIESTRVKAENVRRSIATLVADYDAKVAELELEIKDLPPKQIAEKISAKQAELFQITKELGVKKAEYDGYQAAIMTQNSALTRLVTFGPTNLSITTGGRGTSRGAGSSTRSDDTSGMPAGRGGVRQTSWLEKPQTPTERLWSLLNPFPFAYADSIKDQEAWEAHWNAEWKRFVSQFADYVADRRKVDQENRKEAARLVAARKNAITPENYTFIDQGTLLTIDMFLSELEQETAFMIEGQTAGHFQLQPSVLKRIQETRLETNKARESWIEAQKQQMKILPKSYQDDPDLWWGLMTQVFME